MSSVFGEILTGYDVEQAVEATIDTWLPDYLRELERQKDIPAGSLLPIASKMTVNDFAQYQGAPLPLMVIICPGTEGPPEWHGDLRVASVWWTCGVAVIVEAVNEMYARQLAQLYAAAIRTLLAQRPSLGNFAADLALGVESHEDAPADFLRAGCAVARIVFSILTEGVVTALAGPTVPDPDPQPWPQVETVHIDAERLTT
jgi:hypothetical protein